jgi:hypothetical protein
MKFYEKYVKDNKLLINYDKITNEPIDDGHITHEIIKGTSQLVFIEKYNDARIPGYRRIEFNLNFVNDTILSENHYWVNNFIMKHHNQSGPAKIIYSYSLDGELFKTKWYYLNGKEVTLAEHIVYQLNDIIHEYGRGIIVIDNKYAIIDEHGDIICDIDKFEDLQTECEDIVLTMDKIL